MYYVYILRSKQQPKQVYTGFTRDLKKRIHDHNSGKSSHTKKHKPWELVAYIGFESEFAASNFEKYLKTGSGIAFSRKHFLEN